MSGRFLGVKQVLIEELGLSQIYLSEKKLAEIAKWFSKNALDQNPMPVHDFGDGRLTLTDGHSRAFYAWRAGLLAVPVVYDEDEIVTCPTGQMMYKNSILWCRRFRLQSVVDLAGRILTQEDYERLWIGRCDQAHVLLTQTTDDQRAEIAGKCPGMYLYGASEDLKTFYFEAADGAVTELKME